MTTDFAPIASGKVSPIHGHPLPFVENPEALALFNDWLDSISLNISEKNSSGFFPIYLSRLGLSYTGLLPYLQLFFSGNSDRSMDTYTFLLYPSNPNLTYLSEVVFFTVTSFAVIFSP